MRAASPPTFTEHPLRREIVTEMHLRRFPTFTLPAHVIQLVRIVDHSQERLETDALALLPRERGMSVPRHCEGQWASNVKASWERHSEASTVTVTVTGDAAAGIDWNWPPCAAAAAGVQWAERLPGNVIRATRLLIVANDAEAASLVDTANFGESHLVSCHLDGGVRLWSDFRIHPDGYGRVVIAANGAVSATLARCIQRLQELGNYRNLALIGLPLARTTWARLDVIERSLSQTGQLLLADLLRDDDLLAALTSQSEELLSIAAEIEFRMSATAAYAIIVADRLDELKAVPISGFQSLDDFTSRRFNPAVRTCCAVSRRLELLNARASQFTSLLRTRIETHIENQNGRLLRSMDDSIRMQLRLQHLVEGLSAVAISYYLLGLLSYPLKAAEHAWGVLPSISLLGVGTPLIVIAVWVALLVMRKRAIGESQILQEHGQ